MSASDVARRHDALPQPLPPESFDATVAGPGFPDELSVTSRAWFACGYRPGIAAYLNFFLLRDFIILHDEAFPARFATFRSMADSFYRTDLFIRDVTDSGPRPTGGISSARVRGMLAGIMRRHAKIAIPPWMMTYFGFSLVESVERRLDMPDSERPLHLSYMAATYRIMGIRFSCDREEMESFARAVESAHAAPSPQLERHARRILLLGEMIGAPSAAESVLPLLPAATREVFEPMHARVRPGALRRAGAQVAGRVLVRSAIGAPRKAVPAWS